MNLKEKHFYNIANTKVTNQINKLAEGRYNRVQNYFLIPVFYKESHITVDRCLELLTQFTVNGSTMIVLFINGPEKCTDEYLIKTLSRYSQNNPFIIWFEHVWTRKEQAIFTMCGVRKVLCDFVVDMHRQLNKTISNILLIQLDCDIMNIHNGYINEIRKEFEYREGKYSGIMYSTIHTYSQTMIPDLDMYISLQNVASNILDYYHYKTKRKNCYLIKKPSNQWTQYWPADTCVAYSLISYIESGGYPIPKAIFQETGYLSVRMTPHRVVQIPTFVETSPRRQYWSIEENKSIYAIEAWNAWGKYGEIGRTFICNKDRTLSSPRDGINLKYEHELEIRKNKRKAWLFSHGCLMILNRYPYFILRFVPHLLKAGRIKLKLPPKFK